jgi:hypothetical protein
LWTATADSIIHKIQRLCHAISGTEPRATSHK